MAVIPIAMDKVRRFRAGVSSAAEERGPVSAVVMAASLSVGAARRAGAYLLEWVADLRMGASTRGMVKNDALLSTVAGSDGNWYQPVPVLKFKRIAAAVPLEPAEMTFLDLGAGRGRALLLAAEAGFPRLVGVEIDAVLAAEAERNLLRYARRHDGSPGRSVEWSVLCQDAAEVVVPMGPVLVFVFNPFGRETLRMVLERVEESYQAAPRPLLLAYYNPAHADVGEMRGLFSRIADGRDWALYAVGAAGSEGVGGAPKA